MIFEGKRILVTGGTGSMGKTFVRRVLSGELGTPAQGDRALARRGQAARDAAGLPAQARSRPTRSSTATSMNVLEFRIGDVRDYADVCAALRERRHRRQRRGAEAGAHLRVLSRAGRAHQLHRARRTSCARSASTSYPVETVVGISTDKACKPVNVMGMTKAIQERIFMSANILNPTTRFICVALRQRAGLARLGDSAVPRPDPARRPGHDHRPGDDALPAEPRPGGRLRSSRRSGERAAGENLRARRAVGHGASTSPRR